MKINIILPSILLLFYSCNQYKEQNGTEDAKPEPETEEVAYEISIVDEAFIDRPFEFGKVTIDNLENEYKNLTLEKEPIQNLHVKDQVDTIVTAKIKNSEFILYKLPGEQFLESAVIRDDDIELSKNIRVGMSKDEFKEKFEVLKKKKQFPSRVIIKREEVHEHLVFLFEDEKLKEIEFTGYVD